MNNTDIIPLFAVPMYVSNISVDSDVKQIIKNIEYEYIGNGYASISKNILDLPELIHLRNEIEKQIESYTRTTLFVAEHISFEIINSWAMMHQKGDYAPEHNHDCSLLSGIVYIDTDDSAGEITFRKDSNFTNLFPSALNLEVSGYNIYNSKKWSFTPKSGQIYMFPSFLLHQVSKSNSDKNRYCIAFNVFPKGKLNAGKMNELDLK
jgi:uncharacterized protein (TIGR02466 family)